MFGYLQHSSVILSTICLVYTDKCEEDLKQCESFLDEENLRLSQTWNIIRFNNKKGRLGVISLKEPDAVTTAVTCESKGLTLACIPNHYIQIESANYGRTDSGICAEGTDSNHINRVDCDKDRVKSLQIVNATCGYQQPFCFIKASNALFGDPCPYTYKYLTVDYSCIPYVK